MSIGPPSSQLASDKQQNWYFTCRENAQKTRWFSHPGIIAPGHHEVRLQMRTQDRRSASETREPAVRHHPAVCRCVDTSPQAATWASCGFVICCVTWKSHGKGTTTTMANSLNGTLLACEMTWVPNHPLARFHCDPFHEHQHTTTSAVTHLKTRPV